ncbi:Rho GTPase-activating protein 18 [Triplophysa tibetana]|uniref:Rho GTPase-activating protein 18 n=1 Tax=Triplophysa tibetana TaxID=1572043 RepID=A0A5A9NLD9_9TELE|nr:Rho GTPase-activating protein 18 [Triplophysa tibetana]
MCSHKMGQYNVQRSRGLAAGKSPYQRCNSQESLDEKVMVDYFKELEIIQHTRDAEQPEDVQLKVPDEGEQEEAWLTEAGLATLFDESATDGEDSIVLLSTLTRTQAAAVQRRVETLNQTLRKRNKPHSIPDVRDIFKPSSSSENTPRSTSTSPGWNVRPRCTCAADGYHLVGIGHTYRPKHADFGITVSKACDAAGQAASSLYAMAILQFERLSGSSEQEDEPHLSFSTQRLRVWCNGAGPEAQGGGADNETDINLEDFKVSQDKTGQTRAGDLSTEDMKKVRRLVVIEMSALFDTCGIEMKTHKALKMKVRESGLFGVPLLTLLEQDQRRIPGTKVPLVLQHLMSHIEEQGLDTEGVLRIPGAATRVKSVCQEMELKFYDGLFPWESLKQHDAASVLKLFIRELPFPLLTVEYFTAFLSVLKLPTQKQQLQALNLLVLLLPEHNRDTLKALMEFFQCVIDHKDKNKMTLNNVAVVMAPNIFMCKGFRNKISEQEEFAMATCTANIVRLLIRYQNLLWTIPKFILNQVRKQNTENQRKMNRDRAVKKLLKKMTHDREKTSDKPEKNTEAEGFIRVQAPQFSMVSMAVQLTDDLKASDVLTRFLTQERSVTVKREDLCLFETGGNIKERCLDEETYIRALLELNPSAELVLKSK